MTLPDGAAPSVNRVRMREEKVKIKLMQVIISGEIKDRPFQRLINRIGNLNFNILGLTPLYAAITVQDAGMVEMLLQAGAIFGWRKGDSIIAGHTEEKRIEVEVKHIAEDSIEKPFKIKHRETSKPHVKLSSEKADLPRLYLDIIRSMEAKFKTVKGAIVPARQKELKSMLERAHIIYNKFAKVVATPENKEINTTIEQFAELFELEDKFSELHTAALSETELVKLAPVPEVEQTILDLDKKLQDLEKALQYMRSLLKSNQSDDLRNKMLLVCGCCQELEDIRIQLFSKIEKLPTERLNALRKKVEDFYSQGQKIIWSFNTAISRSAPNNDSKDELKWEIYRTHCHLITWVEKQLIPLLSKLTFSYKDVIAKQLEWGQLNGKLPINPSREDQSKSHLVIPETQALQEALSTITDMVREIVPSEYKGMEFTQFSLSEWKGVGEQMLKGIYAILESGEPLTELLKLEEKLQEVSKKLHVELDRMFKLTEKLNRHVISLAYYLKQLTSQHPLPVSSRYPKEIKSTVSASSLPPALVVNNTQSKQSVSTSRGLQEISVQDPTLSGKIVSLKPLPSIPEKKLCVTTVVIPQAVFGKAGSSFKPFTLGDCINPYQILNEKFSAILDDEIAADKGTDEKIHIPVNMLQTMRIKQNALLMTYCSFVESLKKGDLSAALPFHKANLRLFMNIRDYIYHRYPEGFSCSAEPSIADAKAELVRYRELVVMINQLCESFCNSGIFQQIKLISLQEDKLFKQFSQVEPRSLLPLPKEKILQAYQYFFLMQDAVVEDHKLISKESSYFAKLCKDLYANKLKHEFNILLENVVSDPAERHIGLVSSFVQ